MAVGVSVEFCVHIAVAFVRRAKGSRDERMVESLVTSGSCVFRGIFLTKFLGVAVLYLSTTPLFEVYYFRMYALICILGGAHGLVFLPVLLSFFGPHCRKKSSSSSSVLAAQEGETREANSLLMHTPARDEFQG